MSALSTGTNTINLWKITRLQIPFEMQNKDTTEGILR